MEIGLIGIGRMGAAIGERLLDLGHELLIWNRRPEKTERLARRGASLARDPREIAESREIILTILTDTPAIEAVYDGPQGLLTGTVEGKLFIDMSTVTPQTTIRLADRLRSRGAAFLECPVSGTVAPARDGKLIGLAGGSGEDFARARPILDQLCRRIDLLGPVGVGSAMKLAVNLPLIVYWEALGEALSLVEGLGIPPEKLVEIMAESAGGANVLKMRGSKLVEALKTGPKAEIGFDIDGMRKDLRTMLAAAQAVQRNLPVASAALRCYDEAAQAGLGEGDGSHLVTFRMRSSKPAVR